MAGLVMLGGIAVLSGLADVVKNAGDLSNKLSGHPRSVSNVRASSGITVSDFSMISTGMNYGEVTAILGAGDVLSHSDIAGYSTTLYGWKNRNGSNMNVMFQDGHVVSKAQFGLR